MVLDDLAMDRIDEVGKYANS